MSYVEPLEVQPLEVAPEDCVEGDAGDADTVEIYAPQYRRVRSIRCQAKSSRTGLACGRWAIQGGYTCPSHGSSTTKAKEAARRRLEAMAPFAVAVLAELADGFCTDPSTGVPMAVSPGVRARAAADLLKMSGAGAAQEIDLGVTAQTNEGLDAAIVAAMHARGFAGSTEPKVSLAGQ